MSCGFSVNVADNDRLSPHAMAKRDQLLQLMGLPPKAAADGARKLAMFEREEHFIAGMVRMGLTRQRVAEMRANPALTPITPDLSQFVKLTATHLRLDHNMQYSNPLYQKYKPEPPQAGVHAEFIVSTIYKKFDMHNTTEDQIPPYCGLKSIPALQAALKGIGEPNPPVPVSVLAQNVAAFQERIWPVNYDNCNVEMWCAAPFYSQNGKVIYSSPALNSVWVVTNKSDNSAAFWCIYGANAGGDPEALYVGLDFDTPYAMNTLKYFTPLSSAQNFYNVTMKSSDHSFSIECYYPELPPADAPGGSPNNPSYLTITTVPTPATKADISALLYPINPPDVLSATYMKFSGMAMKGTLMYDLVRKYMPEMTKEEAVEQVMLEEAKNWWEALGDWAYSIVFEADAALHPHMWTISPEYCNPQTCPYYKNHPKPAAAGGLASRVLRAVAAPVERAVEAVAEEIKKDL